MDSSINRIGRNESGDTKVACRISSDRPSDVQLRIMGGFDISLRSRPIRAPLSVQRLLAFLALQNRPATREFVAGCLWPETGQQRAVANLRATLWRTPTPGVDLVVCSAHHIALAPLITVDYRTAVNWAGNLVTERSTPGDDLSAAEQSGLDGLDELLLTAVLLPGWEADWVVSERERLRQLLLHAVESFCYRCLERGDTARAIDAGLRAVAAEPLRESTQRVLIRAHLREGNVAEALRTYRAYACRLDEMCGLDVSPLMAELVAPYRDLV
ncbi:AfsR/SARP family transcriptional regulator [Nocardia takedensis]